MKFIKIFYLVILLSLAGTQAYAQQKLPSGVKFNFETMFPSQPYETVYTDTFQSCYITFKQNGTTMIARYSKEGYWHFTGHRLSTKEVPGELMSFLAENYLKDKKLVFSVYKIETPFSKEFFYLETGAGKARKHYIFNSAGVLFGY